MNEYQRKVLHRLEKAKKPKPDDPSMEKEMKPSEYFNSIRDSVNTLRAQRKPHTASNKSDAEESDYSGPALARKRRSIQIPYGVFDRCIRFEGDSPKDTKLVIYNLVPFLNLVIAPYMENPCQKTYEACVIKKDNICRRMRDIIYNKTPGLIKPSSRDLDKIIRPYERFMEDVLIAGIHSTPESRKRYLILSKKFLRNFDITTYSGQFSTTRVARVPLGLLTMNAYNQKLEALKRDKNRSKNADTINKILGPDIRNMRKQTQAETWLGEGVNVGGILAELLCDSDGIVPEDALDRIYSITGFTKSELLEYLRNAKGIPGEAEYLKNYKDNWKSIQNFVKSKQWTMDSPEIIYFKKALEKMNIPYEEDSTPEMIVNEALKGAVKRRILSRTPSEGYFNYVYNKLVFKEATKAGMSANNIPNFYTEHGIEDLWYNSPESNQEKHEVHTISQKYGITPAEAEVLMRVNLYNAASMLFHQRIKENKIDDEFINKQLNGYFLEDTWVSSNSFLLRTYGEFPIESLRNASNTEFVESCAQATIDESIERNIPINSNAFRDEVIGKSPGRAIAIPYDTPLDAYDTFNEGLSDLRNLFDEIKQKGVTISGKKSILNTPEDVQKFQGIIFRIQSAIDAAEGNPRKDDTLSFSDFTNFINKGPKNITYPGEDDIRRRYAHSTDSMNLEDKVRDIVNTMTSPEITSRFPINFAQIPEYKETASRVNQIDKKIKNLMTEVGYRALPKQVIDSYMTKVAREDAAKPKRKNPKRLENGTWDKDENGNEVSIDTMIEAYIEQCAQKEWAQVPTYKRTLRLEANHIDQWAKEPTEYYVTLHGNYNKYRKLYDKILSVMDVTNSGDSKKITQMQKLTKERNDLNLKLEDIERNVSRNRQYSDLASELRKSVDALEHIQKDSNLSVDKIKDLYWPFRGTSKEGSPYSLNPTYKDSVEKTRDEAIYGIYDNICGALNQLYSSLSDADPQFLSKVSAVRDYANQLTKKFHDDLYEEYRKNTPKKTLRESLFEEHQARLKAMEEEKERKKRRKKGEVVEDVAPPKNPIEYDDSPVDTRRRRDQIYSPPSFNPQPVFNLDIFPAKYRKQLSIELDRLAQLNKEKKDCDDELTNYYLTPFNTATMTPEERSGKFTHTFVVPIDQIGVDKPKGAGNKRKGTDKKNTGENKANVNTPPEPPKAEGAGEDSKVKTNSSKKSVEYFNQVFATTIMKSSKERLTQRGRRYGQGVTKP